MNFVKWLSRIVVSTLFISSLTVMTSWYVMNLSVQHVLKQFHLETGQNQFKLSEFLTILTKQMNTISLGKQNSAEKGEDPSSYNEQADRLSDPAKGTASINNDPGLDLDPETGNEAKTNANANAGTVSDSHGQKDANDKQSRDPEAVSVFNQISGLNDMSSETNGNEVIISAEDFFMKKEGLSDEDKMKIFTMLVAKLSQDEMQQISAYVEDGVTRNELKKIEDILLGKLNHDEFEQLMAIINKY